MSWIPVAEMIAALGIFGFLYWLVNGILDELLFISVTGTTYNFVMFVWRVLPFIVLFFAGIYLLMRMQKREYKPGMGE